MCTEDGTLIRWDQSSVVFSFEDVTPAPLRTAMVNAASDYNDRFLSLDLLVDENNHSAPPYNGNYSELNMDGVNGIYYITGDWPWETTIRGSLAVTLTRYDEFGIREADVYIKKDPSNFAQMDVDLLKYISEHEFGHAIGRSHSKKSDSLMYRSIQKDNYAPLSTGEEKSDFFSAYDITMFGIAYK
jgi:hypothetical protein